MLPCCSLSCLSLPVRHSNSADSPGDVESGGGSSEDLGSFEVPDPRGSEPQSASADSSGSGDRVMSSDVGSEVVSVALSDSSSAVASSKSLQDHFGVSAGSVGGVTGRRRWERTSQSRRSYQPNSSTPLPPADGTGGQSDIPPRPRWTVRERGTSPNSPAGEPRNKSVGIKHGFGNLGIQGGSGEKGRE